MVNSETNNPQSVIADPRSTIVDRSANGEPHRSQSVPAPGLPRHRRAHDVNMTRGTPVETVEPGRAKPIRAASASDRSAAPNAGIGQTIPTPVTPANDIPAGQLRPFPPDPRIVKHCAGGVDPKGGGAPVVSALPQPVVTSASICGIMHVWRACQIATWPADNQRTMMKPDNADAFIVEEIVTGSQSAWRQLIDRYSGRLLAFARARTASLSDAEDLVQETFVGFLQSLGHYDASRSLETYLFTILRYKLYDLLRQRKVTLVSQPGDEEGWWDQVVPGSSETPSGLAVAAEAQQDQEQLLAAILRRLIHELRDRDAFGDLQVIELLFFAGRRNLDVGELLDIDQKAVAGIKFRAIQKLRKYVSERDSAVVECLDEARAEVTVARVWRKHRLTCLKRSTLGSYLMGVLEDPWQGYTQFHLDVVGCAMCVANLADLQSEQDEVMPGDSERIFQSSVGFLKRTN